MARQTTRASVEGLNSSTLPSQFDFADGISAFTAALWLWADSFPAGTGTPVACIFDHVNSARTDGWGIGTKEGKNLILYTFGGNSGNQSIASINTSEWWHLAAVYDQANTTIRIYVNGTEIYSNTAYTNTSGNYGFTEIALGIQQSLANSWDGRIADAGYWSVQLSASEILSHAKGISALRIRPASRVAYWPLFGVASPEPDYGQNGADLTLTNSPTQADHAPIFAGFGFDFAALPVVAAGGAFTLSCDAGSYTVTGQAATLTVDRKVAIDQGSYSITGQAANLLKGFALALDQGSYSVTGQAATLTVDRVLALNQGSYAISGQVTELLVGRIIDLAAGSYAVTGQAVTLNKGFTLIADLGSYTVSGQAVGLIASRVLSFDLGSYAISGQSASLITSRIIDLAQGSYSLSGQGASLLIARVLALNLGTYTVTGLDVTLTYTPIGGFTITLDLGNYAVTGQDAGLIVDRAMALDQGSYAITGQAADLLRGFLLEAEQGSYAITGQSAEFITTRILSLAQGSYVITGLDVSLIAAAAVVALVNLTLHTRSTDLTLEDRSTSFTLVQRSTAFTIEDR